MSVKALSWAFEQDCSGNDKVVLLALADHCGDQRNEWMCFPSRRLLAEKARVNLSTVKRCLARLEEQGLVQRRERTRPNGSHTSNYYVLGGGADCAPRGVSGDPRVGSAVSPPEPSEEPSEETHSASKEWERWLEHYREVTGRSAVRGSSGARASFQARRAKDGYSLEELRLATIGCHSDDYLRGHGYDTPDTILRASKIERYIELGRQTQGEHRHSALDDNPFVND